KTAEEKRIAERTTTFFPFLCAVNALLNHI
ncbi:MAG: hypothetical protein ACI8VT_004005, partial [Saprospiraceae bacterium]